MNGAYNGIRGNDIKDGKESVGRIFAPILVAIVFGFILLSTSVSDSVFGMSEDPYLASVVIQLLVYALPSMFYVKLRGRDFFKRPRVRLFSPSMILYLFHSTVFMLSGVVLLSVLMYTLAPASFSEGSAVSAASFAMNGRVFDGFYLVIAFAVLPAVTEEFLFRSVICADYESCGVKTAVAMSAVMFAMSHFSIVRFPVYLFSGIVLALCMYTTRSVFASIIVHSLNNAVVLFSEKYVLHIADKQNISLVLFLLIAGVVTIVSAMLMCWEAQSIYRGYADGNTESEYVPSGKRSMFEGIVRSFFSPVFLLIVIIFLIASLSIL